MQMTHEVQVKVAVQEALAAQIIERLEKLGASEETELRTRFSKMPSRIYETTIERLATMSLIRKVRSSRDGIVFIAKASASKEDLAGAARRYRKVKADSDARATLEARRAIYAINGTRLAKGLPLTDDTIAAEHDEFLAGTMSQNEHFGLNYDYARFEATYEEAQTETALSREPRQLLNSETQPIGEYQQSLVERQIESGQGRRNAKRARNRYYERDEIGRTIKAIREMNEAETRKERAAFSHAAEEDRERYQCALCGHSHEASHHNPVCPDCGQTTVVRITSR